MKCEEEVVPGPCDPLTVERIRYFTGRHMTARDFRDADAYHRSFRHLHNRVLHGWGIACGLEVRVHPREACRHDYVVVKCGMAIDCCGREILVRKDAASPRIPWDSRPKSNDCPAPGYVLLLCLRYREILVEKVPVLYSKQACSSPAMEAGRYRECYELEWRWVHEDELTDYGWEGRPCPPPHGRERPQDEHDGSAYGGARSASHAQRPEREPCPPPHEEEPCPEAPCDEPACCLDPQCPPCHCVPLAVVDIDRCEQIDEQNDIDTSGRRSIAHAKEHLTHICWTSWEHGGYVAAGQLEDLRVRFDRALRAESGGAPSAGPRGISPLTFVVEYGDENRDLLPYRRPPYLEPDRRTAVFELGDPRPSSREPYRYLWGHVVHVTVRCDFLIDCRDRAVDGDHLHGRLPSGDGIEGGTFESWFTVLSDDDYRDMTERNGPSSARAAEEQQS